MYDFLILGSEMIEMVQKSSFACYHMVLFEKVITKCNKILLGRFYFENSTN